MRAVADTSNDQKADNGRITLKSIGAGGREESVTIDIPRPAIPSAVVALMTRKESSDRPSQMGDVVADDVGGGLVVLSSITPATTTGSGPSRRLAPSLSPYYQVLIKGERLATKPGSADDFTWPRAEPEIAPEPPAVPAKRLPRQRGPARRAADRRATAQRVGTTFQTRMAPLAGRSSSRRKANRSPWSSRAPSDGAASSRAGLLSSGRSAHRAR